MRKAKKVFGENWLSDLDQMIHENRKFVLILLVQFFIMFLMVIGYMKLSDKLVVKVELPKTIKETGIIVVGKDSANKTFHKMWGREDIETVSTFDHKSITKVIAHLKKRLYPPFYYKNKAKFDEYIQSTISNLIYQEFTFAKENIVCDVYDEGKTSIVSIKGFYKKTMDEEVVIDAQPCLYEFGYLMEGGHHYVTSFKTTCK